MKFNNEIVAMDCKNYFGMPVILFIAIINFIGVINYLLHLKLFLKLVNIMKK